MMREYFSFLQNDGGRKCWDIPRLEYGKSWDIPRIRVTKNLGYPKFEAQKKMGYPKNYPGDLLPNATESVAGKGSQNGNRHFAKRISPIKSYH